MTNPSVERKEWEADKQEWLETFDSEYGDLTSKCIGIVARGMYHEQFAPKGADASYITTKLEALFLEEIERAKEAERSHFVEILEDNRGETLWGDEDSNEIMNVSIDQFIVVVKAALTAHPKKEGTEGNPDLEGVLGKRPA